ncbi:hypothetical protein [Cronobacter malonaticus]|uniref:hypothetical protein n=1 Tax=Cronobacter malonaticus TaxID=413503 RepID=UPI001F2850D7|nr:hypothetical protein [Cronobacter malonaticus]
MATNNFKAFALDPNANVMPQADWEALPALLSGFTAGKASSAQVNKAIRQATTIAALVGQFIANSGADALDNADVNGLVTKFTNALTTNLGLGTASKLPAATALNSSVGYITIPVLVGSIQQSVFFQWRTVSVPQSSDGSLLVVDSTWPVPFPTGCMSIMQALNNSLIYATNGTPFSSASIVDRSKFKVASAYSKSQSTVTVWGVGY